jgi:hypothetical protein
MTSEHYHPGIGLDVVSQTFCPGWLWTMILPISASQAARITRLSHHAWLWNLFKNHLHNNYVSWALVVYGWNLSSLENWDQEDGHSWPAWINTLRDPHLQNNQSKMDWRCGSSSRVAALQVWSPEFKPQYHKTNKTMYTYVNILSLTKNQNILSFKIMT